MREPGTPSSSFDFKDGSITYEEPWNQDPDPRESYVSGGVMERNKTERGRLQEIQKKTPSITGPVERRTLKERFNVWLINEGSKKLFLAVWIFLHLLVAAFGFTHYYWNDHYINVRALLGITYRTQFSLYPGFYST
jgi:hypothetical protein